MKTRFALCALALAITACGDATAPSTDLLFTQVSAGGQHTCAITTGGASYCWGANGSGQLGDGGAVSQVTPVRVLGPR